MNNKILKIVIKVITTILSIFMVLLMVLAAYNFFSVKILKNDYSNVFGYTMFEVISGSMEPEIEKWDVILIKLDDEFEVGDVVSFKSDDGAYVTHRVVEKQGDVYITKGDSNNTIDSPVPKERIAGKVVKVFSGLGIWIKVFTTPKIIIAGAVTLILIAYTIAYIKKTEKEKIKDIEKKDPSEERSELMKKLKNNNKLKIELCIFLVLLVLLVFLIPYTLSRFKTEARGTADVDIAFFIANDQYTHQEINLTDMKPGDSNDYTFTVSNNKDGNRTEVNLTYYIEIVATTNLPLDYELYLTNSGVDVPFISEEEINADDDGTYFKIIKTSSRTFDFNNDNTDSYKINVKFPSDYINYRYQDVAENIEIRVIAKQILDSDN